MFASVFFLSSKLSLYVQLPGACGAWHLSVLPVAMLTSVYMDQCIVTLYKLCNIVLQIVQHVESWNITPVQAIMQIFMPARSKTSL